MKAIKFSAAWCQPCAILSKQLAQQGIKLETSDTDLDNTLAKKYNIRGLPTIVILDDSGAEIRRIIGSDLTAEQFQTLKELSIE